MQIFLEKDTKIWVGEEEISGALSSVELTVDSTTSVVKHKGFCNVKDFPRIKDILDNSFEKDYTFYRKITGGILEYTIKTFTIIIEGFGKPKRKKINLF
jgi:hypothetical protein